MYMYTNNPIYILQFEISIKYQTANKALINHMFTYIYNIYIFLLNALNKNRIL